MTKQQTQKALINIEYKVVEPWVHAGALASGFAAFAFPSGGSPISWACIGAGFSFCWYWGRNNLTRTKKAKTKRSSRGPGHIVVNSATGSRKVRLGDSDFHAVVPYQPSHIYRETLGEILRRLIRIGKPEPIRSHSSKTSKPKWLTEFVFYSHYEGKIVQLLEIDVTRFLNAAWRRRRKGIGLGERHWVRRIAQRPQWYKNLGSIWYHALINLLWEVEDMSGRQLIVSVGPRQNALAREPHQILEALKWAQAQKGTIQTDDPLPQSDELIIGTGGVSSFDG